MVGESWRRLHPLSPLVRSGRAVLAVLALAGLSTTGAVGSGTGPHWYDLALVVVLALAAVVNWLVTRWKLDGATLRIETGLLRRDSRQLPVARIQAVDLVRPFLARMLGLAELRVRLAGSGDADGRLAYLTEQAAEALRARLLAAHHGLDPATPEPAESVVTSVPTARLAGSALLSPAVVGGVAAAGVVAAVAASSVGFLAAGAPLAWWLIICGTVAWRRVSTQYAFTVAASPDGVRVRRGLLGTVAETIPVPRIQAVRMIEPLLWRPLHWCRVEVDVAGHMRHDRPEGSGSTRKALLPVGSRDEARWLLAIALPAASAALPPPRSAFPAPALRFSRPRAPLFPPPRSAPAPARRPPPLGAHPRSASPAPALRARPLSAPAPALLDPPPRRARWKAPLSYHFLAAGHDGTLAVAVTGRVRRETTWVPLAKAQSVRLVQGPLQRRLGLATVHLDAAGRRVRAEFRERKQEEARALVGELAALSRSARRQADRAAGQAAGPGQAASVASPVNASQREA